MYIYDLLLENNNTILGNYNLYLILSFDNDNNFYNYHEELVEKENIIKNYLNNENEFEAKYKCKGFLINKNIQKNLTSSIIEKEEDLLNKYLFFYIENSKIYQRINQPNVSQLQTQEYDYYLINASYMDEIESILKFNNIKSILNGIPQYNNIIQNRNIDKQVFENIKSILKEKKVIELQNINPQLLNNKLQNKNKLYVTNINVFFTPYNQLHYFQNCKIINKIIVDIINNLNKTNLGINPQVKNVNCIFDNSKIIMLINQNLIHVGYLDHNKTFITEYIIYPINMKRTFDIIQIFNTIKYNGYKSIENYLIHDSIKCYINNYLIEVNICKIKSINTPSNPLSNSFSKVPSIIPQGTFSQIPSFNPSNRFPQLSSFNNQKNLNINSYNPSKHHSNPLSKEPILNDPSKAPLNSNIISEKLKALLFLSLAKYQDTLYNSKNINNNEKIFLINNCWSINNGNNPINSLILSNKNILNLLGNNNPNNFMNTNSNLQNFDIIISNLDVNKLNQIDKNINQVNNSFPLDPKPEYIYLLNQKKIKIFKEFTLINQQIYQLLQKNFHFSPNLNEIHYFIHKSTDILYIKELNQNTILFGQFNKSKNVYNIQYILDFIQNSSIHNELNIIKTRGPEEYIKEKTVFSSIDMNDNISPIFDSNNNKIGDCYKYCVGIDYSTCINYGQFLLDEKVKKALFLYENYFNIFKKLNEKNNNKEEKYYLINKEICNLIKKDYYFEAIKNKLEEKNLKANLNDKTKLAIIKNIPYINIVNSLNNIKSLKYNKQFFEPNFFSVKNVQNKSILIYENFELFNQTITQSFFDSLNGYENNYLECILNDGKIIIKYPIDKQINKNYCCVIGKSNNGNDFTNEYVLFYKDFNNYNKHINHIKNQLNAYLASIQSQLFNNSAPITFGGYLEFGTIIKLENNTPIITTPTTTPIPSTPTAPISMPPKYDPDYSDNIDISEYNLDYKTDQPSIRANYPYPPLIGVQNIGATCYMNATLQCFCHIEKFVDFFKYKEQPKLIVRQNRRKLSSSFKLLIEHLWPNPNNPYGKKNYAPKEFKYRISKMNPLFKGVAANDAKDLVNFIIMTLHEELNKAPSKKPEINFNIDQRNSQLMFNIFAQNFMKENQSIISDLFYGISCNITQCGGCNTQTFNYQTYFFLVFPLEEVRKFKMKNQLNNNINNNIVHIFDCFNYDRNTNVMGGANAIYCNYCKRTCNSLMTTLLTVGPEILIILLNRGKGIEFNVKINFVEYLDLSNYLQFPDTGCKYKLIGVITHMGESGMGGHFIAYCLDPISTNIWHKYNDDTVTQVNNFKSEVIDYAMPYLLFYQKIK